MWRPSLWKNPYKDHWGKEMTPQMDYETNQHFAYEAGADAMLEALRKRGSRIRKDIIVFPEPELTVSNGDVLYEIIIPAELMGKSTVVIIPNETKD